jgi:hypothetical protein
MDFAEFTFHALRSISLYILLPLTRSQLVATKIIHLGDVLGAYDCYRVRARERKDKIVGTIAEPRKGTLWLPILRTL